MNLSNPAITNWKSFNNSRKSTIPSKLSKRETFISYNPSCRKWKRSTRKRIRPDKSLCSELYRNLFLQVNKNGWRELHSKKWSQSQRISTISLPWKEFQRMSCSKWFSRTKTKSYRSDRLLRYWSNIHFKYKIHKKENFWLDIAFRMLVKGILCRICKHQKLCLSLSQYFRSWSGMLEFIQRSRKKYLSRKLDNWCINSIRLFNKTLRRKKET